MRHIQKASNNEPASLARHKRTPNHNYGNYAEKDDLRLALLKEQGYLCCYCMRRIQTPTEDKMKIEHFKPFSVYNGTHDKPNLILDYTNLLASCKGGEGGPKQLYHCDKSKAHTEILIDPTNPQMMNLIKFTANGLVITGEGTMDKDIADVLRLNIPTLAKDRKAIWESIERAIKKEFGKGTVTKSFLQQKIKIWQQAPLGMSTAHCQVAIYYLTKKLTYTK